MTENRRHGAPARQGAGVVRIALEDGLAEVSVDTAGDDARPSLTLTGPGNTFGLALRTRRTAVGLEVEVLRTSLFGDESSAGVALLPDDDGPVRWPRAAERSDAGRILAGVAEALAAASLPAEVLTPAIAAPRARVTRTAAWDDVVAPDGRPGGLPEGHEPTEAQRVLGGAWSVILDDAPHLGLEARLWQQHRGTEGADGEVVRLTVTWHGAAAEDPWHTELHVAHRAGEGVTEFVVVDGSTEQEWTLADVVHVPGRPLAWRVHPAPRPDEATRTGEALHALIAALAERLEG